MTIISNLLPTKALADTACGNCGGQLVVAADASTSVRCAGDSLNPPCGQEYQHGQWLALARQKFSGRGPA